MYSRYPECVCVLPTKVETLDQKLADSAEQSSEERSLLAEKEAALKEADAQLKNARARADGFERDALRCGRGFVVIVVVGYDGGGDGAGAGGSAVVGGDGGCVVRVGDSVGGVNIVTFGVVVDVGGHFGGCRPRPAWCWEGGVHGV